MENNVISYIADDGRPLKITENLIDGFTDLGGDVCKILNKIIPLEQRESIDQVINIMDKYEFTSFYVKTFDRCNTQVVFHTDVKDSFLTKPIEFASFRFMDKEILVYKLNGKIMITAFVGSYDVIDLVRSIRYFSIWFPVDSITYINYGDGEGWFIETPENTTRLHDGLVNETMKNIKESCDIVSENENGLYVRRRK